MTDTLHSAGLWTPEEDGLLRAMAAAGESVHAITKSLTRTEGSVRKRLAHSRSNLPVPRGGEGRRRRGSDGSRHSHRGWHFCLRAGSNSTHLVACRENIRILPFRLTAKK